MPSLVGFGHYLPEAVLDNESLATEFGVEPGWIFSACGIKTRRSVAPGETVCDLAERAALACLRDAELAPEKLGAIIVGSGTPHRQFPGISAEVQKRLNVPGIPVFDLHLASAGGLFALAVADSLCQRYGPILVVAAETMTRVLAQGPRIKETAILFGDGAGACLVSPRDGPILIRDIRISSDATFSEALRQDFAGGFQMDGRTVILHAVRKLAGAVRQLLETNSVSVEQIELFLFHQANLRLLERLMEGLNINRTKVFLNIEKYGNTSSASLLIAASEARAAALFRPGSKALLAAFGAGLSWGAALLEMR